MTENAFGETTFDVFYALTGYMVGDIQKTEKELIIRFDKQVENVIISRRVMFADDSIFVTGDYVLDILPKEQAYKLGRRDKPSETENH